jgi:hypothetical protein
MNKGRSAGRGRKINESESKHQQEERQEPPRATNSTSPQIDNNLVLVNSNAALSSSVTCDFDDEYCKLYDDLCKVCDRVDKQIICLACGHMFPV